MKNFAQLSKEEMIKYFTMLCRENAKLREDLRKSREELTTFNSDAKIS